MSVLRSTFQMPLLSPTISEKSERERNSSRGLGDFRFHPLAFDPQQKFSLAVVVELPDRLPTNQLGSRTSGEDMKD